MRTGALIRSNTSSVSRAQRRGRGEPAGRWRLEGGLPRIPLPAPWPWASSLQNPEQRKYLLFQPPSPWYSVTTALIDSIIKAWLFSFSDATRRLFFPYFSVFLRPQFSFLPKSQFQFTARTRFMKPAPRIEPTSSLLTSDLLPTSTLPPEVVPAGLGTLDQLLGPSSAQMDRRPHTFLGLDRVAWRWLCRLIRYLGKRDHCGFLCWWEEPFSVQ